MVNLQFSSSHHFQHKAQRRILMLARSSAPGACSLSRPALLSACSFKRCTCLVLGPDACPACLHRPWQAPSSVWAANSHCSLALHCLCRSRSEWAKHDCDARRCCSSRPYPVVMGTLSVCLEWHWAAAWYCPLGGVT